MNLLETIRFTGYFFAKRLGADEEGAAATEYVFLVIFIALIAIAGMSALGIALKNRFLDTGNTVSSATG